MIIKLYVALIIRKIYCENPIELVGNNSYNRERKIERKTTRSFLISKVKPLSTEPTLILLDRSTSRISPQMGLKQIHENNFQIFLDLLSVKFEIISCACFHTISLIVNQLIEDRKGGN